MTTKLTYKVHPLRTSFLGGNLSPQKLEAALNEHSQIGWVLDKTVKETTRQFLIFRRETHFLIFRNQ